MNQAQINEKNRLEKELEEYGKKIKQLSEETETNPKAHDELYKYIELKMATEERLLRLKQTY